MAIQIHDKSFSECLTYLQQYQEPIEPETHSNLQVQINVNQRLNWKERNVLKLEAWGHTLSANNRCQEFLDKLGRKISSNVRPIQRADTWICTNKANSVSSFLTTCLIKFPIRAVRNIIVQILSILQGICYGIVHPKLALKNLAQMLVTLAYELVNPRNWPKMGLGVIGTSLGTALIVTNPFLTIGLIIGATLFVTGLAITAANAAYKAGHEEKKSSKALQALVNLFKTEGMAMLEALIVGFCTGLIVGGVQRAIQTHTANSKTQHAAPGPKDEMRILPHDPAHNVPQGEMRILPDAELRKYAQQFIEVNRLPQPHYINVGTDNTVTGNGVILKYTSATPELLNKYPYLQHYPDGVMINLTDGLSEATRLAGTHGSITGFHNGWAHNFSYDPLTKTALQVPTFPDVFTKPFLPPASLVVPPPAVTTSVAATVTTPIATTAALYTAQAVTAIGSMMGDVGGVARRARGVKENYNPYEEGSGETSLLATGTDSSDQG